MEFTMRLIVITNLMLFFTICCWAGNLYSGSDAVISSELIFQQSDMPFPSCHASTIVETPDGLIVAWFAGSREEQPDVSIWLSRQIDGKWTNPVEVAHGVQNENLRYPAWNPVLFYNDHQTILFYKVGPLPTNWWGEFLLSSDYGKSWSGPSQLPEGIFGPIRTKPILLATGELLCPSSIENDGWRVHMEFTPDMGLSWERTAALNSRDEVFAIQPTIFVHSEEKLQMLCRTRNNYIYSSWSSDKGRTWTKLQPIGLPNPNSGIDGLTMKDGRHLLVYNHIGSTMDQSKRNILNVAVSDDGLNWEAAILLENDINIDSEKTVVLDGVGLIHTDGEYSYPAVIQASDGTIHITYTWKRESIRHIIVDPSRIEPKPIIDGAWPER